MATEGYHDEQKQREILRTRELIEEMPYFVGEYFRGIAQTTSSKTRLGYAYDIRIFFDFLLKKHPYFKELDMDSIKIEDLIKITTDDVEMFMEYLTFYIKKDEDSKVIEYQNDEKGKARKLAAIRSFFRYFYRKKKIPADPASLVNTPKIHQKAIVRLEVNEAADLLDEIEKGDNLTERQKVFHEKEKVRDLAIVTTLLGTGMRVSECVGINVKDIDFDNNGIKITRKGGNEVILYFGDEVRQALLDLLEFRKKNPPKNEDDDALFLSNRGTRITVRSVQNLVKKYAQTTTPLKKISPHKLRSTYGTNLYQATGDIYLVADVLGHADVNTTRKHYAEIEDNRRRKAVDFIKLRKD